MEKKSLINTLKPTKKANMATAPATHGVTSTRKQKMKRASRADLKRLGKASLSDFSFTC